MTEFGEPDWFAYPMLRRGEMLAAIEKNSKLDGRAVNLFRNALTREPRSDLFQHYVGPHLYRPGSHYIYTTPDADRFKYGNWRPTMTAKAIELQSIVFCGLFSNTLSWIEPTRPTYEEIAVNLAPSLRTFNAGYTVHTIEFDKMPIDIQLSIVYSGLLKRIDKELHQFRDYRGFEVVYSGGKSLHFHFCFDLRHLKHELAVEGNTSYRDNWTRDLPDDFLRPAFEICWQRLSQMFCEVVETEFPPDPSLQRWEQLRRFPWALRLIVGAHPLGLPSDHLIRQPVLASDVFQNVKRQANEWFHDPLSLGEACRAEEVRRPKSLLTPPLSVTSAELQLFEEEAGAAFRRFIGAEYPKYSHHEVDDTGFKCFFYNGPADRNPSSFCDGNRSRILLQGGHGFDSDGIPLPATPNQLFEWLTAEHASADGAEPIRTDDCITRRYKAVVDDRTSLATFLDEHIVEMIVPAVHRSEAVVSAKPDDTCKDLARWAAPRLDTHVLIRGPQGCGKSTVTMKKIPKIHALDPGVILFSSPSIRQAEEKVETFDRVNVDDCFVPYLYLSLTALYERFCPPSDRISHLQTLKEGEASWLRVIYERQREVYDAMYAYRRRLFELRDQGKIPVLFATHETLRQHADGGMTRLFYAKDFNRNWFMTMARGEREHRRNHLLTQNFIHRVIIDEVTSHDLVSIHPVEIVEWAQQCAPMIGYASDEEMTERYRKFVDYLAYHPCDGMSWDTFLDIMKCEYQGEDAVEVSGREVPFDETDPEGIYASMVGRRYYVRPRGWWNQFWRVTMLTTEAVPTRIVEAIDREAAERGEKQDDRFKVYSLDLPASSRDTVTVELQRPCRKETLPALVRAYRDQYPNAEIITDMVKARIAEFAVNTHMSAKGSNAYIDADLLAFYSNPSPVLFGELGALNARFNRSDLVRLFYLDQFEQTTGRNRGFRGRKLRSHTAVFPPRLYHWLAPAMTSASYVGVLAKPCIRLSSGVDDSDCR